ncbi:hypothetical protein [Paenibacillus sp. EZ-K15]|uniref:hypothetical protein n=1 Tax=Paenibacillus sp. EZ-K15 TaxID=2044275 RepID=UPI001F418DEC|nr:hypothetical protein [Paenibacillus sp. EZ-K15]
MIDFDHIVLAEYRYGQRIERFELEYELACDPIRDGDRAQTHLPLSRCTGSIYQAYHFGIEMVSASVRL